MMIFQNGFQHVYVFLANCFDYKRGYMNMYNMYTYSLLLNLIYFHNFWFLFFSGNVSGIFSHCTRDALKML